MQGAKYDVTGFGRCKGQLDGFQITHFTDKNGIRIFTQSSSQRIGK